MRTGTRNIDQYTPFKYNNAIVAAMSVTSTQSQAMRTITPPIITWSSNGYSSIGKYLASVSTTAASKKVTLTPVKQIHYPFYLGTNKSIYSNVYSSTDHRTSINNINDGIEWETNIASIDDYGDIMTTPSAMVAKSKAAGSLRQPVYFQE